MQEVAINELELDRFTPLVNTTFRVQVGSGELVDLVLAEATAGRTCARLSDGGNPARPWSFSLIFRGTRDRPLPQGTFRYDHPQLGTCALFTVPIGPGPGGLLYEVLFNRQGYPV